MVHKSTSSGRCVPVELLKKCPNSKKTPLPYKIPVYAPDVLFILIFVSIGMTWLVIYRCEFTLMFFSYFDKNLIKLLKCGEYTNYDKIFWI